MINEPTSYSYLIVIDNGKPHEERAKDEDELRAVLKKYYLIATATDSPYLFDIKVYAEQYEDISESQFITEMIGDIMSQEDEK